MLENKTEHTFIVTADAASILHAQINPFALAALQGVLFLNGMIATDKKRANETGIYYSRKISF